MCQIIPPCSIRYFLTLESDHAILYFSHLQYPYRLIPTYMSASCRYAHIQNQLTSVSIFDPCAPIIAPIVLSYAIVLSSSTYHKHTSVSTLISPYGSSIFLTRKRNSTGDYTSLIIKFCYLWVLCIPLTVTLWESKLALQQSIEIDIVSLETQFSNYTYTLQPHYCHS